MVRLGLCCTFLNAPIKFRTTTARYSSTLNKRERARFYKELADNNAQALLDSIKWCGDHGVGAFRITSNILPMFTHPDVGWRSVADDVASALRRCNAERKARDIRLSFHPDQFVVPGSMHASVVDASLRELEYMAEVAELVGAEQLTIHGGGAQGGKIASLERLEHGLARLSPRARTRVVLENDDRTYTVEDLLPICERLEIPLVYDVHHHRCNPDRLTIERATDLAAATWSGREPWAHLSSPIAGWRDADPRPHADFIDPRDVPAEWLQRTMTIDIEAKAKENAVLRLQRWLARTASRSATASAAVRPSSRQPR